MKTVYWVAAAAALFGGATCARAGPQDFMRCDGMPAPREMTDERAARRNYLGLENPPRTSGPSARTAEEGIRACNLALADPALREAYWLRRLNLLQSKAYHLLWAGDFADALASLDQADALARPDPDVLYDQSAAIASRALRASALFGLDRAPEAEALLVEIERSRPYSVSTARLTRNVRELHAPDRGGDIALLRRQAVLDPVLFYRLFMFSLLAGNSADALEYARHVSFDIPRDRIGWSVAGQGALEEQLIETRANFDGAVAYALLTSDRAEESAARIAAARADLAAAAPPADGQAATERVSEAEAAAWPRRRQVVGAAMQALDRWEATIQLRREISTQTPDELIATARQGNPTTSLMMGDLLRHVRATGEEERAALATMVSEFERELMSAYLRREAPRLADVGRLLPPPEFLDMRPRMRGEGANILRTNLEGYAVRTEDESDAINVRYGDLDASNAMVEEAAMLAAARYAREQGFDSIVLSAAQMIERTVHSNNWYGGGTSSPSGYEFRIVMRAVNAASLPAELASSPWRLIPVDAVIVALDPQYGDSRR